VIFIITGAIQGGKTTFLKGLVNEIKQKDFQVTGFLSESVRDKEMITGYDLFDIRRDKSVPFIRRTGEEFWEQIGPFFFVPGTLALAKQIILQSKGMDYCAVDEVGPLEVKGKGFWPALEETVFSAFPDFLMTVRKDILEKVITKLEGADIQVYDTQDKDAFSRLVKAVCHE